VIEAGLSSPDFTLPLLLFLLATFLASGVARVTPRFLFGLKRSFPRCFLLLLVSHARGFRLSGLFVLAPLFGFAVLSRLPDALTIGRDGFTLRSPFGDLGIIEAGPRAEFVQKILLGQPRCFLSIGEAGLLESTH
jgi:hypothetical protein